MSKQINNNSQAIDTLKDMDKTDLKNFKNSILLEIKTLTKGKFSPTKLIWSSDYYGTGKLGSFHYKGTYNGQSVVVKVQGAKPAISEVEMIAQFEKQNKSKLINSPKIIEFFPWSSKRGYEVIIFEYVDGKKIVESGKLTNSKSIKEFFAIYQEYRRNSINEPWLIKPRSNLFEKFNLVLELSKKIKPNSILRHSTDLELAKKAMNVLSSTWQGVSLEFQHGHFSVEDLIKSDKKVTLFSNLFWKWKYPFFDTIFAYHWFMYSLYNVKNISVEDIDEQRNLWVDEIRRTVIKNNLYNEKLIKAAFLERALVGLLIDGVAYSDENNKISIYLMEKTRDDVIQLTKSLV